MFGFASVEEARSASIEETYRSPAEREALLDRLRRERRLENDERFRRRRDGSSIHVVENIIGRLRRAGTLLEIRGYIIEDTQRHRAETALLQRERTLRGIFRAAPVGIGMDSRRTITEANDQLCRMTGYARDELIGRNARMLYPDDEAYAYVGREKHDQIVENGLGRSRRSGGAGTARSSTSCSPSRRSTRQPLRRRHLHRARYHDAPRERTVPGGLRRGSQTVERGARAVRVRGEPRPAGAAPQHRQLLPTPRTPVQGQARRRRRRVHRVHRRGRHPDAGPDPRPPPALADRDARAAPRADRRGRVVADVVSTLEAPIREAGATVTVGPMPTVMADPARSRRSSRT